MAKKMINWLLASIIALTLGACTEGGDIGDLYGEWALDQCTVDGAEARPTLVGDCFFKFQGNLMQVILNQENNTYDGLTAMWHRSGDAITIDFHKMAGSAELLSSLGFEPEATTIRIVDESSKRLALEHTDSLGRVWKYRLRKVN